MENLRFQEVGPFARACVCIIDNASKIVFANEQSLKIFGYQTASIIGETISEIFKFDLKPLIAKSEQEISAQTIPLIETKLQAFDGNRIEVRLTISKISNGNQDDYCLLAIWPTKKNVIANKQIDFPKTINEIARNTKELLEYREKLAAIFEQNLEWKMLAEIREDGKIYIDACNKKGLQLLSDWGIKPNKTKIKNMSMERFFKDILRMQSNEIEKKIAQYNQVIRNRKALLIDSPQQFPLNPNKYFEETISPIVTSEQACKSLLISIRDTTSAVLTSNALSKSEEKFRSLFDRSSLAEFEFNKYSHSVSFNQKAREILQIPDNINSIDIPPSIFAEKLLPGGLEQVLNSEDVIRIRTEFSPSHYRERYQFPTLLKENIFVDIAIVPIISDHKRDELAFLVQIQDITEQIRAEHKLQKAIQELNQLKSQLERENYYLREEASLGFDFADIIFSGSKIKEVLAQVEQVAATDATVLISGETGTGKELIAKAIHNISPRKARPLIKLNCATLPKEMIESELFGHEKGAFTGAINRKVGRFELADGGTIFLDEIGELPIELQPKLLRVLQEGEFERVGGTDTKKVNVRVVAATNRDLELELKAGNFRLDLYYRLNVFPVRIPPLRERSVDIPALIWHFVKKYNQRFNKNIGKIPEKLMQWLIHYNWPGNVRELENLIERAMILAKGTSLRLETFPIELRTNANESASKSENLDLVNRSHILKILNKYDWVINGKFGAAQALGLKPSTLRDKMKKLDIHRPDADS